MDVRSLFRNEILAFKYFEKKLNISCSCVVLFSKQIFKKKNEKGFKSDIMRIGCKKGVIDIDIGKLCTFNLIMGFTS